MNAPDFNAFQLILLAVLSLLLLGTALATLRGWASRREGFVWGTLCLAAALATIWPRTTAIIAEFLGIGRGADLVFYCAVAMMMVGFWLTYIRLRHLRSELTLLVRHIAIMEADREASSPSRKPASKRRGQSRK